jgi:hypothetical protein
MPLCRSGSGFKPNFDSRIPIGVQGPGSFGLTLLSRTGKVRSWNTSGAMGREQVLQTHRLCGTFKRLLPLLQRIDP